MFFTYLKISKDSSPKYYQIIKKEKSRERCQSFSKEEKEKRLTKLSWTI